MIYFTEDDGFPCFCWRCGGSLEISRLTHRVRCTQCEEIIAFIAKKFAQELARQAKEANVDIRASLNEKFPEVKFLTI